MGKGEASFWRSYSLNVLRSVQVYDVCARRKCQWWVVTTYWGWVFGAFSEGEATSFSNIGRCANFIQA